jgi:excisionase family DNA binding protein
MSKLSNSPAAVTLEPLRLTIRQAAQMLGMSPAQLYRRLQAGELRAQKDGVSTFILPDELRRYVATRTAMYQPDPQVKQMALRTAPKRMETRARRRALRDDAR